MAHYSFKVSAGHPVGIPKPFVMLDTGNNVFNAEVDDLNNFLALLHNDGVTVHQVSRLDDFEENSPSDLLLPGEDSVALPVGSLTGHQLKGRII